MAAQNMATITASLERSLQKCSLSGGQSSNNISLGVGHSSTPESRENNSSDTTLELNSQISLPYHWEQCLDLKTGEIYYINWRTGMKVKDDPRTTATTAETSGEIYSEEEDESYYDSEESSTESSSHSSSSDRRNNEQRNTIITEDNVVLVVGGCKRCLMYFMVPKQVKDCPKCCGQLLHFDRSESDRTSP